MEGWQRCPRKECSVPVVLWFAPVWHCAAMPPVSCWPANPDLTPTAESVPVVPWAACVDETFCSLLPTMSCTYPPWPPKSPLFLASSCVRFPSWPAPSSQYLIGDGHHAIHSQPSLLFVSVVKSQWDRTNKFQTNYVVKKKAVRGGNEVAPWSGSSAERRANVLRKRAHFSTFILLWCRYQREKPQLQTLQWRITRI